MLHVFKQVPKPWINYVLAASLLLLLVGTLWWRQTSIDTQLKQQSEQLQVEPTESAARPELAAVEPANSQTDFSQTDLEQAEVILIEYIDLNCSFCKQFHQTLETVTKEYGTQVAWVVRHYPTLGSQERAAWLECVGDKQGTDAYWQYIESYYAEITSTLAAQDDQSFADWLAANDYDQLDCDLETYKQKILQQHQEGVAAGVVGTPTLVIETASGERELVMGALAAEDLRLLIESYLPVN